MSALFPVCEEHNLAIRFCDTCDRRRRDRRQIGGSLETLRREYVALDERSAELRGMEAVMSTRLPRVCRDAVVGYYLGRR